MPFKFNFCRNLISKAFIGYNSNAARMPIFACPISRHGNAVVCFFKSMSTHSCDGRWILLDMRLIWRVMLTRLSDFA